MKKTAARAGQRTPSWSYLDCLSGKYPADSPEDADDTISSLSFDNTGEYLATGDTRGFVNIFKRDTSKLSVRRAAMRAKSKFGGRGGLHADTWANPAKSKSSVPAGFAFYHSFRSHEGEFDYLKSLEIEEKINQITWCRPSTDALLMLTTNDKTIKLFKVRPKKVQKVANMNFPTGRRKAPAIRTSANLKIPTLIAQNKTVAHSEKKCYKNAHSYHINSISVCSDGQHFLSADDLRINLWNLSNPRQSFNIVDIKPTNMDDLTEVITSAAYHPKHCQTFMYSTSCGKVKLGDHRQNALCDKTVLRFEDESDQTQSKSFFSEIIASISDVCFSPDGGKIVARDYMHITVWDIRQTSKPLSKIKVAEHLKPRLCDLYENDCIFDKFEFAMNKRGDRFATGAYNYEFNIFSDKGEKMQSLKAEKPRVKSGQKENNLFHNASEDVHKKILHTAWHPSEDVIAVAAGNDIMMFAQPE